MEQYRNVQLSVYSSTTVSAVTSTAFRYVHAALMNRFFFRRNIINIRTITAAHKRISASVISTSPSEKGKSPENRPVVSAAKRKMWSA